MELIILLNIYLTFLVRVLKTSCFRIDQDIEQTKVLSKTNFQHNIELEMGS